MPTPPVPSLRIDEVNQTPLRADGDYVLYWMIAHRRTRWNFSLQHAVTRSRELGKPLLVLEALRSGYPWASERLHHFVIEGMVDNARRCKAAGVRYLSYVEGDNGEGRGLLESLAERAALVVTDWFPSFFLPKMVQAAGRHLAVRLEQVDGNGLLPLRATDRVFKRAVDFRRFLQGNLAPHLAELPEAEPLAELADSPMAEIPAEVLGRWPAADLDALLAPGGLGQLPIDHTVAPVPYSGGAKAAEAALDVFLARRLERYGAERNAVSERATSELSPYLHFGHISTHEILASVGRLEGWDPARIFPKANGARRGWWGMSEAGESFLDELVTWRELGYNMSWQRDDYDSYDSLPPWAIQTLEDHAGDERPYVYTLEELEEAKTHDELWNAAQRELLREGRIHNYLRMLWGKKILEWSAHPREALAHMVELNNKYAVDGRNPNSYSGIFWCLGRYDRAWGPERPIFGKIRYMSSDNTRRKLDAKAYLRSYGSQLTIL